MAATAPAEALRNPLPQRSAHRETAERPLYYPRALRDAGAERSDSPAGLARDLFDLHTAMRYEAAAAVAQRIVDLAPASAVAHYNLAAVLGRLHRTPEALDALERAVELGWRDAAHLAIDPDLRPLRGSERYARVVAELEEALAAERRGPAGSAATRRPSHLALPAPPDDVAGEAGLRVIALAALIRHGGAAVPVEPEHASPQAQRAPGPPAVDPLQVVSRVESATSEPFPATCRRLVLGPLGLEETGFAGDGASGLRVETTADDLGLVLEYLAGCARAPAEGLDGLARWVGLSAQPDGEGLRISYRSARGLVVLRYDPAGGGDQAAR
jgi:hypothetical protein